MRHVSAGPIFGPALLLIGGRGAALAVTFVVPVVLARILAPADFGTYRQLLLVFTTLYGIAQLGMAESLFYFLPSAPERAGRYLANTIATLALAGALGLVLLAALDAPLAALLGNPALRDLAALLGAYLLLMLVSVPLEIAMVARKRHAGASIVYAVSDVARAALTLLPALVWGRLDALVIGIVAFAALRVVATGARARRDGAGRGGARRLERARLRRAGRRVRVHAAERARARRGARSRPACRCSWRSRSRCRPRTRHRRSSGSLVPWRSPPSGT
jgi:O-antigen/teichoic acid export membrane protein